MLSQADLRENVQSPGIESWSLRNIFRDYRKVFILGLLTGLIAFIGSFIVPPTYGSSTRVLIRGRDSTLLASSGESLSNQPGVIDSQLAAALTETQAGILNTRSVAIEIVDRLDLDAPVDNSGFVGAVRKYGAGTYLRARAYLAHGFYREVERRERMIGQVQGGIGAEQVGDSYVLEIAGLWEEPEIAAQIANEAANIMVEQSIERSSGESAAYRDFLSDQVGAARIVENQARLAVAEFQNENEILNLDEILALSSRSVQGLDDEIDRGLADLDSLTARAFELEQRLEETERTISNTELITTGRSTTSIDSVLTNPTYTALDTELQQIRAEAAGAAARLRALELARSNSLTGATGDLNDQEAALRVLLLDLQIAEDSLEELNEALRSATINSQRPQVEVLRLDAAATPTYPLGPKRYLYLAIGLFVGSLFGFIWSFLKVKRREAEARGYGGDDGDDGDDEEPDGGPNGSNGHVAMVEHQPELKPTSRPIKEVSSSVVERERVPIDARSEAGDGTTGDEQALAKERAVADRRAVAKERARAKERAVATENADDAKSSADGADEVKESADDAKSSADGADEVKESADDAKSSADGAKETVDDVEELTGEIINDDFDIADFELKDLTVEMSEDESKESPDDGLLGSWGIFDATEDTTGESPATKTNKAKAKAKVKAKSATNGAAKATRGPKSKLGHR